MLRSSNFHSELQLFSFDLLVPMYFLERDGLIQLKSHCKPSMMIHWTTHYPVSATSFSYLLHGLRSELQ